MSDKHMFGLSDVTVVSVCYKSDALIGGMVNSIPEECPIILVDNGGVSKFEMLPKNRNIHIARLERNEGFGRGCNAGAAEAKTKWLLFLNPDARLERGALEGLLRAAREYPHATAFNPRIANSDGSEYFKRRSYLLPRREYMERGWPLADCQVPVLSGAAFFISKAIFQSVGGFDPSIFLYHEDDDISLRLRKFGCLMFVRDAIVVHASGYSSGRSPQVAYLKAYHMAQSRIYAGKKYGRPFARLLTVFGGLLSIISPTNFFSARRRAKSVGFLIGGISKGPRVRQCPHKRGSCY